MSNLLNRKKLLDRGPKIEPTESFKLDDEPKKATEVVEDGTLAKEAPKEAPKEASKEAPKAGPKVAPKAGSKAPTKAPKTPRKRQASDITSVRVSKQTRNKLNALIQLGKADSVDVLIDALLEEYMEANLVKEDKKVFNLILDIIQKRDK